MRLPSLNHLSGPAVLTGLIRAAADERTRTAILLAYIGEADARRLHAAEGYDSMLSYCIGELRMSRDAARKRIHAARAAREFGAIYDAVAEGRLHLSAVVMLAPRLTSDNADELLAAATHKTKEEIESADRSPLSRPGSADSGHSLRSSDFERQPVGDRVRPGAHGGQRYC